MKISIPKEDREKIKRKQQIKKNSYTVKSLGDNHYSVISKSNPENVHLVYLSLNGKWFCNDCKGFIYRLTCTHIEQAKIIHGIEKNFGS